MNLDKSLSWSFILDDHPLKNTKKSLREEYIQVLSYFIKKYGSNSAARKRLQFYNDIMLSCAEKNVSSKKCGDKYADEIDPAKFKLWRRKKYRFILICDIFLILCNKTKIKKAADEIIGYLSKKLSGEFEDFLKALFDENKEISETEILFAGSLIDQCKKNYSYFKQLELRVVITANMSSGKSTLINAIAGKQLARTSQEVCTGNICYFSGKPFEDKRVSLKSRTISLEASQDDLVSFSWNKPACISSYFRTTEQFSYRLCIIDTPGVNSALNESHCSLAREVLINTKYDKVVYVFSAEKLGTDEEISHLKWVSENVEHDKIVFVMNKIDCFRKDDGDDISTSIENVKNDLIKIGFTDPIVCPVSSKFGLLIKKHQYGDELTEDEQDEYQFLCKKFNRSEFDLSKFYGGSDSRDSDFITYSKKCGIYGVEKIIFGGKK